MKAMWPTEPIDGRRNDRALRPLMPDVDYMSRAEAIRERDEALLRVQARSVPWRTVAWDVLRELVRTCEQLTSDDLIEEMDRRGLPRAADGRACGPVMQRAIREGLLVPAGFVQGRNPKHHADVARLYWTVR